MRLSFIWTRATQDMNHRRWSIWKRLNMCQTSFWMKYCWCCRDVLQMIFKLISLFYSCKLWIMPYNIMQKLWLFRPIWMCYILIATSLKSNRNTILLSESLYTRWCRKDMNKCILGADTQLMVQQWWQQVLDPRRGGCCRPSSLSVRADSSRVTSPPPNCAAQLLSPHWCWPTSTRLRLSIAVAEISNLVQLKYCCVCFTFKHL